MIHQIIGCSFIFDCETSWWYYFSRWWISCEEWSNICVKYIMSVIPNICHRKVLRYTHIFSLEDWNHLYQDPQLKYIGSGTCVYICRYLLVVYIAGTLSVNNAFVPWNFFEQRCFVIYPRLKMMYPHNLITTSISAYMIEVGDLLWNEVKWCCFKPPFCTLFRLD